MNIIETLRRQHEETRDLLERIMAEDDRKEARSLRAELSRSLRLHMLIEEKIVYAAAGRAFDGDEDEEEMVLESFEEHAVAKRCLEVLEATPLGDRRFVVRVKVLEEIFLKHVEEEESELFPELEGKIGREGLEKLSEQVERRMPQLEAEVARGDARSSARSESASAARGGRVTGAAKRAGRRGESARGAGSRGGARAAQGTAEATKRRGNAGPKPGRGKAVSRSGR